MRYENSFEQDKYAAGLRREQSIFEELIRAKGHMVLPDLHQASRLIWQWHPAQMISQPQGGSLVLQGASEPHRTSSGGSMQMLPRLMLML